MNDKLRALVAAKIQEWREFGAACLEDVKPENEPTPFERGRNNGLWTMCKRHADELEQVLAESSQATNEPVQWCCGPICVQCGHAEPGHYPSCKFVVPPVSASLVERRPDGYAYRYPGGGIRFNYGCMVNGSDPIEVIAYYFREALAQEPPKLSEEKI
jgi:hypothetical protein